MEGGFAVEGDHSSLDVVRILRKLQSVGFCSDINSIADSSTFEQVLSVFLKELHCKREIRPLPVMLGDGRPMDLYKLYRLVSERGGYEFVTASKSWAVVAERIGLDSALGCPLKLIYAKYLNKLERCLQRVSTNRSGVGGYSGSEENLGVLMSDSESEVRTLFKEILKQKKDDVDFTLSPYSARDQFLTPVMQNETILQLDNAKCDRPNGSADLDPELGNGSCSSRKRKREPLVEMLRWVKNIAKNPFDTSSGSILPPDGPENAKNAVGLQYSHTFQVRKALFKNLRKEAIDEFTLESVQKMHPFIYEDCNSTANPSLQSQRCSQNTHSSDKPSSYSSPCFKAFTVCMSEKVEGRIDNANVADNCRRMLRNSEVLPDYLSDCVRKRIPVGPCFQAHVPAWTAKSATLYDSDELKWLGSLIWSPEHHEKEQQSKLNLIGKGREDGCKCRNPGSVECVRFHVAEKRLQLKCEMGAAFYAWRFHLMGEEVALSWKEEEERRFKATFRLNQPHCSQNFWKQLHLCFPGKGNKNLVSYYFNVFLLARRSYQNRVSPNNIDSDDEETEFGFLSCTFGYGALRFHDPRSIICAQNLQCVDLAD